MLELNLPPVRFRRAGSPGFFLTWLRGSLFAGGIHTNIDDDSVAREYGTVRALRSTCVSRCCPSSR